MAGESNGALDVVSLVKAYAVDVAIGPLSFSVHPGEFFSLLGPSGCGKSTTLRCIAGFETSTSGEIHLGGERIDRKPAYRRDLGLVFQSHALFPHLNVNENVGFGLKLRKIDAAETARRVAAALELVGLRGLGDRMPSQLSGGQQQRVALARALVIQPPLLLLDEPLSSLDLKLRQQMRDELKSLQRRLGQTTVFVTHDQTEALAMSDRIAVLSAGRIEQIGTPQEIYQRPASRFVADFIGKCNIIEATIETREGKVVRLRTADGATLCGRVADDSPLKAEDRVWAMIRPEAIDIGADKNERPGRTIFDSIIHDIEFLGEDTQVRLNVPRLPLLTASVKTTRAASARIGTQQLSISVDAEDVYVIGH